MTSHQLSTPDVFTTGASDPSYIMEDSPADSDGYAVHITTR